MEVTFKKRNTSKPHAKSSHLYILNVFHLALQFLFLCTHISQFNYSVHSVFHAATILDNTLLLCHA